MLPNAGPGLTPVSSPGHDAAGIAAAAATNQIEALYLLHVDPLRDMPNRRLWKKALTRATTVIAHADFLTDGLWEHANIVFPAESHAEKEGTMTNVDGRVQRLRPAIARPDAVRGEWQVLADLCKRLDHDTGFLTGPMTSAAMFAAIGFYEGLTLDEIGGRGVRWPGASRRRPGRTPTAARSASRLRRTPRRPTATCAWARSARSGRRRRSSARRR